MQSDVVEMPLLDRLWVWFDKNRNQVLWGVVVVAVVGVVGGFVSWRRGQRSEAASEALSNVSFPDPGIPRGDQAGAYLGVAKEYPSTSAAVRAEMLASATLYSNGKYAEAQKELERFTREHRDSEFLGQALLGIAACLDAQGKTNEAVAAYKSLAERQSTDIVAPPARFALARLYQDQGKPELAKPMLESLIRGDAYSSIANEASMQLEEMKLKYPNLFAPPPAPPAPLAPTASPMVNTTFNLSVTPSPPAPAAVATGAPAPRLLITTNPPTTKP